MEEEDFKRFEDVGEWWRKYATKTMSQQSLHGKITTFYDKWGALLATRDSYGKSCCVYYDENEYLDAIRDAPKA